jgi:hypothetical protein
MGTFRDLEKALWGKASPSRAEETSGGTPRTTTILPTTVVQIRKYAARFAARLGLTTGTQLDGYVADLLSAIALNRFNPEDYFPDELLFCQTLSPGAVALNFSRVALCNPLGSGVIAVVTRIAASLSAVAGPIQVGTDTAVLTVTVRGAPRDGRVGTAVFVGAGNSQCFLHSDNNLAVAFANGPVLTRNAPAFAMAEWGNQDDAIFILAPGEDVVVTPQAVNTALTCEYWWRERPLQA